MGFFAVDKMSKSLGFAMASRTSQEETQTRVVSRHGKL